MQKQKNKKKDKQQFSWINTEQQNINVYVGQHKESLQKDHRSGSTCSTLLKNKFLFCCSVLILCIYILVILDKGTNFMEIAISKNWIPFFHKKVSIIIDASQNGSGLKQTLLSIKQNNQYSITQLYVIVSADNPSKYITELYPEAKIIQVVSKQLQFKTIWNIIEKCQTQYIFYITDQWILQKKGFISQAIKILMQNQQIKQIILQQNILPSNQQENESASESQFKFSFNFFKRQEGLKFFNTVQDQNISMVDAKVVITNFFIKQRISSKKLKNYAMQKNIEKEIVKTPKINKKPIQYYKQNKTISSNVELIQQKPMKTKTKQEYAQIRQQYNQKFEKYKIKFSSIPDQYKKPPYWNKNLQKHIPPASQFHMGIKGREQFKLMQNQWDSIIPFEIFQFQYDQTLEKPQQKLNLTDKFNNLQQINNWLYNQSSKYYQSKIAQNNSALNLAIMLSQSKNQQSQLLKEAQYLYMNAKYGIEKDYEELPMCIFSNGYNTVSKKRFVEFFNTIQRLNYTNYRLVIADDNSKDNSIQTFYEYFRNSTSKLKNRLFLAKSIVQIKSTGHLYYGAKYFCKKDEILVNVDTDDEMIGYQTLKVLNAVFQDPQIWFVHARFLSYLYYQKKWVFSPLNAPLTVSTSKYRQNTYSWVTSHLKAYRQAMWQHAPIQYFIQYHYDQSTGYLEPLFYDEASDRPIIYYVTQICGNSRIKHLPFGFYFYYMLEQDPNDQTINCYTQHMFYEQYKLHILTPLKKLKNIDDVPEPTPHYSCSEFLQQRLSQEIQKLKNCETLKSLQMKLQNKNDK